MAYGQHDLGDLLKQLMYTRDIDQMKRNMELVRQILLKLNDHEHGYAPTQMDIEDFTDEEIGYHCLIMSEAGLIQAVENSSPAFGSPSAIPTRLTWEGHEFIENAQNPDIWSQTKEVVGKVGDVSFSVWAGVLTQIVMENLGISG